MEDIFLTFVFTIFMCLIAFTFIDGVVLNFKLSKKLKDLLKSKEKEENWEDCITKQKIINLDRRIEKIENQEFYLVARKCDKIHPTLQDDIEYFTEFDSMGNAIFRQFKSLGVSYTLKPNEVGRNMNLSDAKRIAEMTEGQVIDWRTGEEVE